MVSALKAPVEQGRSVEQEGPRVSTTLLARARRAEDSAENKDSNKPSFVQEAAVVQAAGGSRENLLRAGVSGREGCYQLLHQVTYSK